MLRPRDTYPYYWKPTMKIGIRKNVSLTKEAKVRIVWVVWLEEPGDKYFKEFMAKKPFTNAYEMAKDLVRFLESFITEYPSVIERYKFDLELNRVAGIIDDDEIQMIKREISGITYHPFKFN